MNYYEMKKRRNIKMEEILKEIGISEKTIKQMEEMNPNIRALSKEDILHKIEILKNIGCDEIQVRNIISSNALYLDKTDKDIEKLIKTMEKFGFDTLNILFDGNPYILNLEAYEIEEYIKNREDKGELLEDIVDDMSSNPFLFEEM